jgi:DnaJ-class molecular chaperone
MTDGQTVWVTCRACSGHGVTWHHDRAGATWCAACPWCLGTGRQVAALEAAP